MAFVSSFTLVVIAVVAVIGYLLVFVVNAVVVVLIFVFAVIVVGFAVGGRKGRESKRRVLRMNYL